MLGPCINPERPGCLYRRSIGHHLYWPKRAYETDLEKAFRNLPENIVQMCRCAEQMIHDTMRPPKKPSVEEMIVALTVKFEDVQ